MHAKVSMHDDYSARGVCNLTKEPAGTSDSYDVEHRIFEDQHRRLQWLPTLNIIHRWCIGRGSCQATTVGRKP